ncbi:MAG: NUDIX domain-containing protein [Anaerolineae bacterium]|mgnify:FL=1|nr:NUDIX domain-containing protein [Anaerolineae bacterium]MBN8620280.1 NUDIX domain-containing protein [Anaerolineae bacterium]
MRVNHRVRALLLTHRATILLIKRVRQGDEPYWVLPGGGVEPGDGSFEAALRRELKEELGATAEILHEVFMTEDPGQSDLEGWLVQHHFFICRLLGYDLSRRDGPEFLDPTKGEYIPEEFPLDPERLSAVNIFSDDIKTFLVANIARLRDYL